MFGTLIKGLFKSLSLGQILVFVVGTIGVYAIEALVPAGDLRTTLLALDANVLALLTTIFRKPSTEGGTVAKAIAKEEKKK